MIDKALVDMGAIHKWTIDNGRTMRSIEVVEDDELRIRAAPQQ